MSDRATLATFVAPNQSLDLARMSPEERWKAEDVLDEARDALRAFNDEELRRWVEEEGKTQAEIAAMVGRARETISRRCSRLGITPKADGRGGRPRSCDAVTTPDDEEVIDAEVVEGEIVGDDTSRRRDKSSRVRCPTCGHLVHEHEIRGV